MKMFCVLIFLKALDKVLFTPAVCLSEAAPLHPIRQGITGTDNFVFSYNQEKEQYFALLQAKPGAVSNLLTITNDGEVYSYILKYSPQAS